MLCCSRLQKGRFNIQTYAWMSQFHFNENLQSECMGVCVCVCVCVCMGAGCACGCRCVFCVHSHVCVRISVCFVHLFLCACVCVCVCFVCMSVYVYVCAHLFVDPWMSWDNHIGSRHVSCFRQDLKYKPLTVADKDAFGFHYSGYQPAGMAWRCNTAQYAQYQVIAANGGSVYGNWNAPGNGTIIWEIWQLLS